MPAACAALFHHFPHQDYVHHRDAVDAAVKRVFDSSHYIWELSWWRLRLSSRVIPIPNQKLAIVRRTLVGQAR